MPVKKQVTPKYPDQYSVELNRLLLENRPLRWYATPVAGTVLSAVVILGLAGCNSGAALTGDSAPQPALGTETTTMGGVAPPSAPGTGAITMGDFAPPPIFGTPFFEHGNGVGTYGCQAVAAPVFLSEDDAFAIIKDEFKKSGLVVRQNGGTIENIQIPKPNPYYSPRDNDSRMQTVKGRLDFDFTVQGRNIVMEYVSTDDMRMWESAGPDENGIMRVSTVSRYDYKEAARTLNDGLNRSDHGNVHGVFYDPVERVDMMSVSKADDWKKARARLEKEARQRASAELREQVKDFIEWLSAQGII